MSKKNEWLSAFGFRSLRTVLPGTLLTVLSLVGCDRGASVEVEAAKSFADAVARNETARRDSMIATEKFLEFFRNSYVSSDMLSWFRTFYDYKEKKFIAAASADVDRDLTRDLAGALRDTTEIEESGMVRVRSPLSTEDPAYFWMVKQRGAPWKVAMVTKGEAMVNFK